MKRKVLKLFIVLLVSVTIETVVFQGATIMHLLNKDYVKNKTYILKDFATANWITSADGLLVSSNDPILVVADVNTYVDVIHLNAEMPEKLPYIDVFYTNDKYHNYGDVVKHCDKVKDNLADIKVGDNVKNLRIDLGDAAGAKLTNLTVVINPVSIKFSFSRIIAMLLIYYSAGFLFALQKMPDYHLEYLTKRESDINEDK